jgi:hypothetical protein
MPGLRELKIQRAMEYILAHPDESKAEQSIGAEVGERTIAMARAQLVKDGRLTPSRKKQVSETRPYSKSSEDLADFRPPPATEAPSMLDHAAMLAIAEVADAAEEDLDDDEVSRRLLRQCVRFAFDPKLHPDTRMSASQMWTKLRDQAKARNLGPGAPKTYEDAVRRYTDLTVAVDIDVAVAGVVAAFRSRAVEFLRRVMSAWGASPVLEAVNAVFEVKEAPDEGQVPAEPDPAAPGPAGPPAAP